MSEERRLSKVVKIKVASKTKTSGFSLSMNVKLLHNLFYLALVFQSLSSSYRQLAYEKVVALLEMLNGHTEVSIKVTRSRQENYARSAAANLPTEHAANCL